MLDVQESSKFTVKIVKHKATVDAHGYVIDILIAVLIAKGIYIHTCVGFGVARFDNLGNARASERGTSNKDSHAFLYVSAIK